MWIYRGSGNANFYYAVTLVIGVLQVQYLVECISIVLKNDYLKKKDAKIKKAQ